MFGSAVIGAGLALNTHGSLGIGLYVRDRPRFGWKATGCAEAEDGSGSRAIGDNRQLRIARRKEMRLFASGAFGFGKRRCANRFEIPIPVALFGTIQAIVHRR